ncbi:MAG: hypothetical protein QXR60_05065, partial [Candidatus Nanoarchaeia archaeon]
PTGNVARESADFTLSESLIKVAVKQQEYFKRTIRISNTGSKFLVLDINSNLGSLLQISEPKFTLPLGDVKDIKLSFYAPANVDPGVYVGRVDFNSETIQDSVYAVVEVESKKVVSDVSINIPDQFRNIEPGKDLLFNVRLFNFVKTPADVDVFYEVRDFNGDIVYEDSEKIYLESEASFSKSVVLPSKVAAGDYVVTAKIVNGPSVGTSAALFSVLNLEPHEESPAGIPLSKNTWTFLFVFLLFALIITILVTTVLEYRKLKQIQVGLPGKKRLMKKEEKPVHVEQAKPSRLMSLIEKFRVRRHKAVVPEEIKTIPPLKVFQAKLKQAPPAHIKKISEVPGLEFPHLKEPIVVLERPITKKEVIEEGKKLAKLSKKLIPKVKVPELKVERVRMSKEERELRKQEALLRSKLEGL